MRYITISFLLLLAIARAADPDLAGKYTGEWKSNSSGGAGTFRMSLERAADGAWKSEVSFTFGGDEVKTIMRQVKVEQSKVDVSYDFDLLGNMLRSRVTGELKGNALEGKYQTTAVEGGSAVDDGTWNASRAK